MADIQQPENNQAQDFIVTNPVNPVGPAKKLFIAGASVFEITVFTPPLQRVTILGINLPEPDTFGPYDSYIATLTVAGTIEPLATLVLLPTADSQNWAATTFLDFGGTLPTIDVAVRPQSTERIGDVILQGTVFP